MSKKYIRKNSRNSIGKGFIFLIVGAFFLLRSLDLDIPEWVGSWEVLLIGIGAIIWFSSEFKNNAGIILMLVGSVFLMRDIYAWPFDISRFIWPGCLILIGIMLIFRKQGNRRRWSDHSTSFPDDSTSIPDDTMRKDDKYHAFSYSTLTDDYLDVTAVFSGVNRVVVSKEFKGGTATAVFGGSDINLTQADFNGTIEIEANCVFGGVEIVVPSNWNVKVKMDTVFGGVEDNRPVEMMSNNPDKVLIIKGTCVFGGVEIKSYN
jgi:predicted membrane protein